MTLLSRCLSSFCTDGLVDIIAGLSAGHHRVGVHFSLPQRLVDFRKTSYAKYTVPTSFCKAVGQIGHTRHNTVILFFHIFLPVFYPFYCTTLSKFVYLLTHICISFFNQNWLQCDVCLRRWSVHLWWSIPLVWQKIMWYFTSTTGATDCTLWHDLIDEICPSGPH